MIFFIRRKHFILHVAKSDATDDATLRASLNAHFARETELHPNRIDMHPIEELRRLQGVGTQLKEQRVVDHRPANQIVRSNGKISHE